MRHRRGGRTRGASKGRRPGGRAGRRGASTVIVCGLPDQPTRRLLRALAHLAESAIAQIQGPAIPLTLAVHRLMQNVKRGR